LTRPDPDDEDDEEETGATAGGGNGPPAPVAGVVIDFSCGYTWKKAVDSLDFSASVEEGEVKVSQSLAINISNLSYWFFTSLIVCRRALGDAFFQSCGLISGGLWLSP
jgi:hypothetical protein